MLNSSYVNAYFIDNYDISLQTFQDAEIDDVSIGPRSLFSIITALAYSDNKQHIPEVNQKL